MKELEYPSYASASGPRFRWSAVIAGTVTSLVLMACLSVLGIGVGFLAAPAADSAKGLAVGMGLGGSAFLLIAGLVSFYLGGWVTSRLSDSSRAGDGAVYGFVTWGTATLVGMFVIGTAIGGLFGSALSGLSSAAGTAATAGTAAAAQSNDNRSIEQRIRSAGEELRGQARTTQDELQARTGGGAQTGSNQPSRDTKQKAETASQAAGAVGLFAFVTMLLEAGAAMLGGRVGARFYIPVPARDYHPQGRRAERELAER